MALKQNRALWVGALILITGTNTLFAQGVNPTKEALKLITETSKNICARVPIEGSSQSVVLTGDAQAKLTGFFRKVFGIGIDRAATYDSEEYKSVLRKDLASAIEAENDCALSVFNTLVAKLSLSIPAPPQDLSLPKTTFRIPDQTSFADGRLWLKIREMYVNSERACKDIPTKNAYRFSVIILGTTLEGPGRNRVDLPCLMEGQQTDRFSIGEDRFVLRVHHLNVKPPREVTLEIYHIRT